jgi:sugar-phosphatase
MAVDPADCLVVEDAPAGVEAARAAGMRVVALTTTHRLDELRADACTASLAGIHLGRIEQNTRHGRTIELLVLGL